MTAGSVLGKRNLVGGNPSLMTVIGTRGIIVITNSFRQNAQVLGDNRVNATDPSLWAHVPEMDDSAKWIWAPGKLVLEEVIYCRKSNFCPKRAYFPK